MAFLSSHRRQRRLLWIGVVVAAIVAFVVAAVALPTSKRAAPVVHYTGPVQTVVDQQEVLLTRASRRAIDDTLNRFVHTGVDRSDPSAAWELVTPAMRAGVTRAQWNAGTLPVVPFPAQAHKPGWTVLNSYPGDVTIDVILHARAETNRGAIAFAVGFKKRDGRWLVDSMVPEQVFGGGGGGGRSASGKTSTVAAVGDKAALSPVWFVVPGILLGLAILAPAGFALRSFLRHRAIERAYREGRL